MRKTLIPYPYDPHKSPKSLAAVNYAFILKLSTICLLFLLWFILLGTHKSVDETAHKYLRKKDVRSFWGEHNALRSYQSFQEEKPSLKDEGCGSGGSLEICPGNRPRSIVNCKCRALAWEECGYNTEKECDDLLGLQCINNTCIGPYHLKATLVSQNSIHLVWDDFKPTDYLYEYVLLRSSHFFKDFQSWQIDSVGNEPGTVVSRLQSNHGYFFRVATWKDPSLNKYRKVSGAIFVKTKAGCHHEGKWFNVDDIFKVKCEEKCRCLANGRFACEPLCPEEEQKPEMTDPNFKCFKELIQPTGCCYKIICVRIDGSCLVDGSRVSDGTIFNTTCSKCICNHGRLDCTKKAACPPKPPDLPCDNPVEGVIPDSCCPSWHCPKNCFHHNRTYKHGDFWRQDCDEQCVCLEGNIQCRPICKTKTEQMLSEDCLSPDNKTYKGGDGCCTAVECLPKDECHDRNKTDSESKMFYSPDCQICICRWNGQKVCHQLFCPHLPKLNPNPICLYPQVHPGQCCPVLYCHQPSTVSPNVIQNLTAKASGLNSIFLTFHSPSNRHLLNYTNGYDVQYRRQSKFTREDWTMLTTLPMALNEKSGSGSLTTVMVNDLEVNVNYLFRVRIHLDWKRAKRLFDKDGIMADEEETNMELSLDLLESVPLAETKIPPESIIPFSSSVSANTSIEGDCMYKNQTLKVGEIIQDNCQKHCECRLTGISCRPVCGQITEKPRENCFTTSLPIDCCISWICQPERRPYRTISMSVSFDMGGSCRPNDRKWADDVIEAIRTKAEEGSGRICGGTATGCLTAHVQVTCADPVTGNPAHGADERRRNFRVHIKWTAGQKGSRPFDLISRELKTFVEGIGSKFLVKDFRIPVQGIFYGPSQNWQVSPLSKECEEGFSKTDSNCVETHPIYRSSPTKINPNFHVEEITGDGAILKWHELNQLTGQYSGNISIVYRQSEDVGKWIRSKSLNASSVSYVLHHLLPGRNYNVKMVWRAEMFGVEDFILATTSFTVTKGMSLLVDNNDHHEMFLLVTWERLEADILSHLKSLELVYQKPDSQKWCSVNVTHPNVTTSQKIGVIKTPGNYTVRLSGHLENGRKINILPTHIRIIQVMPSHSKQSNVLTGAVVSVCLLLIVGFIAVILWRRRYRRRSNNSGYDNKFFGLQLSESQKSSTPYYKA